MLDNLKKISQSGIKALLKKRVENPKAYLNKPLIIWRVDNKDGIQEGLLNEVLAGTGKVPVAIDNGFAHNPCKNTGLYTINALYMSENDPASAQYLQVALNERKIKGGVLEDAPIVAYMNDDAEWFENPLDYPTAEQYVFEPNFEEWVEQVGKTGEVPGDVIDFIKETPCEFGQRYLWYNMFNPEFKWNKKCLGPQGVAYPADWATAFRPEMIEMVHKVSKLSELSEEDFDLLFGNAMDGRVKELFRRYASEHDCPLPEE